MKEKTKKKNSIFKAIQDTMSNFINPIKNNNDIEEEANRCGISQEDIKKLMESPEILGFDENGEITSKTSHSEEEKTERVGKTLEKPKTKTKTDREVLDEER